MSHNISLVGLHSLVIEKNDIVWLMKFLLIARSRKGKSKIFWCNDHPLDKSLIPSIIRVFFLKHCDLRFCWSLMIINSICIMTRDVRFNYQIMKLIPFTFLVTMSRSRPDQSLHCLMMVELNKPGTALQQRDVKINLWWRGSFIAPVDCSYSYN